MYLICKIQAYVIPSISIGKTLTIYYNYFVIAPPIISMQIASTKFHVILR